jgi:proteic killer suppression protein
MIKGFRHRGIETFFTTGSKAGIQPHHASRLARQLKPLDRAKRPEDMNIPGWQLHPTRARSGRSLVGLGRRQLAIDLRFRR